MKLFTKSLVLIVPLVLATTMVLSSQSKASQTVPKVSQAQAIAPAASRDEPIVTETSAPIEQSSEPIVPTDVLESPVTALTWWQSLAKAQPQDASNLVSIILMQGKSADSTPEVLQAELDYAINTYGSTDGALAKLSLDKRNY